MDARTAFVARELSSLANEELASSMAEYMKTEMPFYGVPSPSRKAILREMLRRFPIESRIQYNHGVGTLWGQPHREEKYLAVGLARSAPRYITVPSLPLYRRMIVDGAWWDLVDEIASHLVGQLLADFRPQVAPVMEQWVGHRNIWVRRGALLAHLRHKHETDRAMLFEHCLRLSGEKSFFIRKAIGWILREYAKTAPGSVSRFVVDHRADLSGLTFREATKHLELGAFGT